ncbi:MAG: preprotein translocase subunit SecE [Clostridia bacterium]|nr:preprotein translocase subunit SecE [Clostridia bacterium]
MSKVVKEENTEVIDSKPTTKQEKKSKENKKKVKDPNKKGKLGRKASETIAEIKKVTWPSFGSILSKTGMVLAFCAGSLVLLLLIDLLLKFLLGLLGL